MNNLPNKNGRVERFFQARIDRALDEARPLDRVTAWYVRRHSDLRDYYESLLRLEIELRFSNEFAATAVSVNKPLPKHSGRVRILATATVAMALLVFLTATVLFPPEPTESPGRMIATADPLKTNEETQERIDLAHLFDLAIPLAERIATVESPFAAPVFSMELPVQSVVRFSEQPLESTLNLLETTQLLRRRELDEPVRGQY